MKNLDITDNLDNIKLDYKYEIKGDSLHDFPTILLEQYQFFKSRLENTNIEKDCKEIKDKVLKNEGNNNKNENVEKELEQIIAEYISIKEEAEKEYYYYLKILYRISSSYHKKKSGEKVKEAKDIFMKISKELVDINIRSFINKEKRIILLIDKIKDFKKLLYI
jgi:hypothetical protein